MVILHVNNVASRFYLVMGELTHEGFPGFRISGGERKSKYIEAPGRCPSCSRGLLPFILLILDSCRTPPHIFNAASFLSHASPDGMEERVYFLILHGTGSKCSFSQLRFEQALASQVGVPKFIVA